jgi:pSer/pThr/pTyr-binding forkhead associated (FHA) protein
MTTEPNLVRQPTGEVIPLGREPVTIGRKSTNVVRLADDPKVSRLHARVYVRGGDYVVEDEQSSNGTFVNEQRLIRPQILQDGDTIRIGGTAFTVHLPPDEDEPTVVGVMPTDEDATFIGSVVVPDSDATFVSNPSAVGPAQPPPTQPSPLSTPVAPPLPTQTPAPATKRSSLGKWLIILILLIILGAVVFFLFGAVEFI